MSDKKKETPNFLSGIPYIIILLLITVVFIVAAFTDIEFPFDLNISEFFDSLKIQVEAINPFEGYTITDNDLETQPPSSQETPITPKPSDSGEVDVYVIDVGQGSSTLFVSGERSILIDAGENGNGKKIAELIRSIGLSSIDIMIGTHPHSDHIGGMDEVMEEIDVKNIIMPELPRSVVPTTKAYLDVLKIIERQGKSIIPANPTDSYQVGDMFLEILGPVIGIDSNLNNFSVVSKISVDETTILVTGDAEESAEKLLPTNMLKCDILIVGHHGSKTSTSSEFISFASPTYAAISSGVSNKYGHPNQEVLDRLNNLNCIVHRTDKNGTIIYKIKNNTIFVEGDS